MERTAAAQGKQLSALSADELESLWNEAKARESAAPSSAPLREGVGTGKK